MEDAAKARSSNKVNQIKLLKWKFSKEGKSHHKNPSPLVFVLFQMMAVNWMLKRILIHLPADSPFYKIDLSTEYQSTSYLTLGGRRSTVFSLSGIV